MKNVFNTYMIRIAFKSINVFQKIVPEDDNYFKRDSVKKYSYSVRDEVN